LGEFPIDMMLGDFIPLKAEQFLAHRLGDVHPSADLLYFIFAQAAFWDQPYLLTIPPFYTLL
jgi:hypothetical protein